MNKKAVILLSGGLDSVTALGIAIKQGYDCYALSFDYGQKQIAELNAARRIAASFYVKEHRIVSLPIGEFGGSALTDENLSIPNYQKSAAIPPTYVPARNTIFLSVALSYAEVIGAHDIFIGVSCVDYSGYPDCRPEFIQAFQQLANLATKAGVHGNDVTIQAPLLYWDKAETIRQGIAAGVDYSLTVTCYSADEYGRACGVCDSCVIRKNGFRDANLQDPTKYRL